MSKSKPPSKSPKVKVSFYKLGKLGAYESVLFDTMKDAEIWLNYIKQVSTLENVQIDLV